MKRLMIFFLVIVGMRGALIAPLVLSDCQGMVRTRPNAAEMSDEEWDRFADAVRALQRGGEPIIHKLLQGNITQDQRTFLEELKVQKVPTVHDQMVKQHIDYYSQYHDSIRFFAWHRLFMLQYERQLQRIDDRIMLPYWDFTLHRDNLTLDPALSKKRFGGSGERDLTKKIGFLEYFVTGTFKDMRGHYLFKNRTRDHYLSRSVNFTNYNPVAPASLLTNYLKRSTLTKMRNHFEPSVHGVMHIEIGQEFAHESSPNDPLFFAYHAFVDKLWYDWQNMHNNFGYHNETEEAHPLIPWNIPTKDVLNPNLNICSTYKEFHYLWDKSIQDLNKTITDNLQPPEIPVSGSNSTQQLIDSIQRIAPGTNITQVDPLQIEIDPMVRDMYNNSDIKSDLVHNEAIEFVVNAALQDQLESDLSSTYSSSSSTIPIATYLLLLTISPLIQ